MDRHDRSAGREERQDVVGHVEQVDPFASQAEWDPELLGHRVRGSTLRHRPEILAKRLTQRAVLRATEENVLVLVVEASEVTNEVLDVSANAKVTDLADIDPNAHRSTITKLELDRRRRRVESQRVERVRARAAPAGPLAG